MSVRREHLGAFPTLGPLPFLHLSEDEVRGAAIGGPFPSEATWFHMTYPDRLSIILRTGLIPTCWFGGDSCAVFGLERHEEVPLMRKGDWILEIRSCALAGPAKAWWVPLSSIYRLWRGGVAHHVPPATFDDQPHWPRQIHGCDCSLSDIVSEQQALWRSTWSHQVPGEEGS
jgi:hypothetical protein